MALQDEQVVDIPGLSGEEIIIDLMEQLSSRLRRDCNLRPSDSYINGYSAEVSIKLHCFGIDTADVESTVQVKNTPLVKTEGCENNVSFETEITVAHEPDLTAVRERSQQEAPDVENKPTQETASQNNQEPHKRRYGSVKPPRVAGGGAGSFDEQV